MPETYAPLPGYPVAGYAEERVIHISSDKKIGGMNGQISVQGEANSQYIVYEMDRYHDGVDLSNKLIQIHYERSDGVGDNSVPVNVCASDEHIRFGWIVPQKAVVLEGVLKVMPFATGVSPLGDVYTLKTAYAEYKVQKGLAVSGGIEEPEEEWYQGFVADMAQRVEDAKNYAALCADYEKNAGTYRDQAGQMLEAAAEMASRAERSAQAAVESAQAVLDRESEASGFAGQARSYAVGTGGEVRESDDADCAKYFYELVKTIAKNLQEGMLTFDISDQTPVFSEAAQRENIASNEKLSVILGKTMKFFSDLSVAAFSGSYNDLSDRPEIPTIPASLPANGGNADTVGGKNLEYITNYNNLSNKPKASALSSASVAASKWTGTAPPYTNVITVSGVTANSVVDVSLSSSATAAQYAAFSGAGIADGGQGAGSVTLKAYKQKPEVDIPITIVVRGDA